MYVRTGTDEITDEVAARLTAEQIHRAREAVAEVRGMTRFLRRHQDEFAEDLLKLFEVVEPLISPSDG